MLFNPPGKLRPAGDTEVLQGLAGWGCGGRRWQVPKWDKGQNMVWSGERLATAKCLMAADRGRSSCPHQEEDEGLLLMEVFEIQPLRQEVPTTVEAGGAGHTSHRSLSETQLFVWQTQFSFPGGCVLG